MNEQATHRKVALVTGANKGSAAGPPSSSPSWA